MAKENVIINRFEPVVMVPGKDDKDILMEMLADDDFFNGMAELFKVLGDPTRAKIIQCLQISELCVCDIAKMLNMTHSAVSHQLRVLRSSHLVKYRREGRMVFYSLSDEHVSVLMREAAEHISE